MSYLHGNRMQIIVRFLNLFVKLYNHLCVTAVRSRINKSIIHDEHLSFRVRFSFDKSTCCRFLMSKGNAFVCRCTEAFLIEIISLYKSLFICQFPSISPKNPVKSFHHVCRRKWQWKTIISQKLFY